MTVLNEDQVDYMRSLGKIPPEEKCWCGWFRLDECNKCNVNHPGKTRANFLAQACPECFTLPPTHVKGCSRANKETP